MTEQLQGPFLGPFKGLNLSNAAKSIDPDSAAVFHNVAIDESGAVVRRRGTVLVSAKTTPGLPSPSVSLVTQQGTEFSVYIDGLDVVVQAWKHSQTSTYTKPAVPGVVFTKANVFRVAPTQVNYTVVRGENTRLLIFTGNHPVIQITFDELRTVMQFDGINTYSSTSNGSEFTAPTWLDPLPANYLFRDESFLPLADLSRKPNSLTVSGNRVFVVNSLPASPALRPCVITHVTWQWWAEADMWYGRDLVQTKSRVNVTVADQTLAVPPELTTDADVRFRSSQQHQLLLKNSPTDANNTLGLPVSNPSTVNAWGMSSGSRYIAAAGSNLTPTDDFVTFGTIEPVGTISTLWFTAVRALRLNNGNGIAVPKLSVVINKSAANISFSAPHLPTEQAVNLWNLVVAGSVTNLVMQANATPTSFAQYFSANVGNLSLTYESEILLINQDTKWVGTGAAQYWFGTVNAINGDGGLVPVPGLGRLSDYYTGNFHTNGVVFANRLALVNPPGSSDQLSFSATGDTFNLGVPYTYFQVTNALDGLATDPFTASPITNSVTAITALQVWQNNLFVFTRSEVYAVTAGESFSSTSYGTERISTYGCYNQNCVTLTNLSILYLNELGVFDLLTKANTSEYGTFERSSQVRNLFLDARIRDYEQEHWIAYDENTNKLYVGLRIALSPDTTTLPPTATKLCVLDLYWNAWATWAAAGSNVYQQPFTINTHMLMWVERVLVSLEFPDHADFIQSMSGTFVTPPLEESLIYLANRTCQPAINPVTPGLRQYGSVSAPISTPGFATPVDGLEIYPFNDTLILLTNQALATRVWQRNVLVDNLEFTDIVAPPFTGYANSFTAMVRRKDVLTDSAYSYAYYVNICRINSGTYYTPVQHVPGEVLSNYYGGIPFHSQYSSPVFNLATLGRLKRLKKLHLLFDTRNQAEFNQAYYLTPGMQQRDAALVTVTGNYNDYNTPEITSYLMRSPNDMLQLADFQSSVGRVQQSIPLQGYGCDYQFHVASAGAEPFRLTGYEFDVTPQNSKRYVRGDT
jgi:hypothetical protein